MTKTDQAVDVYSIVTNRIIEQLELSIVPWKKPWSEIGPPCNLLTTRPYTGINTMLLAAHDYSTNYFLTFEQLKAIGGSVLKDEKGHVVVFYKRVPKDEDKDGESKKDYSSVLRYYKVFNIAQCRDIPERLIPSLDQQAFSNIATCDEIVNNMPQCPVIKHSKQEAYYDPKKDYINMPKENTFVSVESYYSTIFHELLHSTGHQSRLNRKEITENHNYGSEMYSQEELTAEIGACMLSSVAGIIDKEFDNSLAYINGWLRVLKKDKRLIVFASSQAQKAVDFILNANRQEN